MAVANELYHHIVESAHGPVLIIKDEQAVDWNAGALELLGYSAEELTGKAWLELMAAEQPDGRPAKTAFRDVLDSVRQQGQAPFNWALRCADGSDCPTTGSIYRLEIDDECFQISLSTFAADLPVTQADFRLLFDAIPDAVVIYDLDGNVTYLNPAFEETFGWTLSELFGKRTDFVPDESREETMAAVSRLLQGDKNMKLITKRLTKDGRKLHVNITATLFDDADGNPAGSIIVLRDETEFVRTQAALELSEAQRLDILENIEDGFFELDHQGRIVYANPALTRIFGYSLQELVGMEYQSYVDEESIPAIFSVFNKIYTTGEAVPSYEYQIYTKDGDKRTMQLSISLARNENGEPTGFRGIARDITERSQTEEKLRQSQIELEKRVEERASKLAEANIQLQEEVAERKHADMELQRTVENQQVLNALLQISQENIPLEEQLDHAMKAIFSSGWMRTLPKGSIFLVEDEPDVLVLKSEQDLGKHLLKKCARVPFGKCLCGRAAATGQPLFRDCVDEEHEIRYQGMQPHGHYNLPILINEQVVGVLNLYVAEGHEPRPAEQEFLDAVTNTLANMIQHARDEQAIQASLARRERQVHTSTQIAQEIAVTTDLSQLYNQVVTLVKEQFDFYHVQLLRYDPAMDLVALVVGYGEVGQKMVEMHHSMPLGVGLIGQAAATGQPVLYADVSQARDWRPNPLLPQTRSELAVPIKLRDEVLGVLDIQSHRVNGLGPDDQLAMSGLCGQIAVAIESTRLRQDMAAQLEELTQLQRSFLQEGWQTYRQQRKRLHGFAYDHSGLHPIKPEDMSRLKGKTVKPKNGRTPSPLTTPLAVRDHTIGHLIVEDDPKNPLTNEEHLLIQSISEQIAEALESARLFEQTQVSLAEQERLAGELETVAKVSTAASTILEVDALLQSVVDLAKTSFGLYHAHIYLRDEFTDKLVLRAGADSVGRLMVLEGREIDLEAESLIARAARTRQGIIENDVRKTIDFVPHPLLPNTQAELAVPMIVGDKLMGVLDLQSEQVGIFREEEMDVYRTLASQVGVAVQNATLFSEQIATADKLREVDRLKSEFLASMSHELRTPLNSIIGFADVLLEGLDGDLNDRMEEDVRLIRDSGSHLRELIGEILDMSKIEAGRMELRYERIDMREMAQDIIATARPLVQQKSLDLFLELADDVEIVEADRTRIRQVMWNILGNAVKFTERGHVKLTVDIEENKMMRIGIHDTGIGIKPENIPVVFEQFRQVDGKLNRKVGGTGLGLPITKKLIEIHGGDIWIESEVGEGSTFWFTLPLTEQMARVRKGTSPLPSLE